MASQVTTIGDRNGLMRSMMTAALERMLYTEMDVSLGRRRVSEAAAEGVPLVDAPPRDEPARKNRRNGHSQESVNGDGGDLRLQTPRDHLGPFEPKLIGKHQRRLAGLADTIRASYA